MNSRAAAGIRFGWQPLQRTRNDGQAFKPTGWQPLLSIRFEFVVIHVDSARFDSPPGERLNSRG